MHWRSCSHGGEHPCQDLDYKIPFVIGASAIGTVIEWYDFYLYAVLATFLAPIFFPGDPTAQVLSALATFGAGFAVRPFGAIVFGRIGDKTGRKVAFLLTVSIMGGATVLVGLLPGYAQIGILAPIILVTLRIRETKDVRIWDEVGGHHDDVVPTTTSDDARAGGALAG